RPSHRERVWYTDASGTKEHCSLPLSVEAECGRVSPSIGGLGNSPVKIAASRQPKAQETESVERRG
ncbi:hypothetical protein AVEN_392-1, partial [Araneus ventricosus]